MKYINSYLIFEDKELSEDEIKDYFLDLIDDFKGCKFNSKVNIHKDKSGIRVEIFYDMYYQEWVEKDVKEIVSQLKLNYNVTQSKRKESGLYNYKYIPVHGKDTTSRVTDPIYLIKLIINY